MNISHAERIERINAHQVPPTTPEDHIAHSLQKSMVPCFAELLHLETECRTDRNLDSLRRFRLVTMNLMTLVGLLDTYLLPKVSTRFTKRLRKLLQRVDDVYKLDLMMRDLLVHGEGAQNRMAVAGVIAHLDAQRLLSRDLLLNYLNSKKYHKFLSQLEIHLVSNYSDVFDVDGEHATDPHQVQHVIPAMIYRKVADVRACEIYIADSNAQLLTKMWDVAVQLRCLLEAFEGVMDDELRIYVDELETLIAYLEKIAELDHILERLIHLPRANLNTSQFLSMKNYRRHLQSRRDTLQQAFPGKWQAFNQKHVKQGLADAVASL